VSRALAAAESAINCALRSPNVIKRACNAELEGASDEEREFIRGIVPLTNAGVNDGDKVRDAGEHHNSDE
jgi:hypothetical protein